MGEGGLPRYTANRISISTRIAEDLEYVARRRNDPTVYDKGSGKNWVYVPDVIKPQDPITRGLAVSYLKRRCGTTELFNELVSMLGLNNGSEDSE